MKKGYIQPFKVSELKKILDTLPDDTNISYEFGGELFWDEERNTLYVQEV